MKVSQIMKKAYVIDDNVSLKQAAKIMSSKKIGGLVVIADGKIKGIVTERDVIKNIGKLESPVRSSMSKPVISVSAKDDSNKAAELMSSRKIRRLPVIDEGKLVGMVRITDIVGKTSAVEEGEFFFE